MNWDDPGYVLDRLLTSGLFCSLGAGPRAWLLCQGWRAGVMTIRGICADLSAGSQSLSG